MEIKRIDINDNGELVAVYDNKELVNLLRYCTEKTESYNEKTRDAIEKLVNEFIKSYYYTPIIYENLEFLRKFRIKIDTSAINLSDYHFRDIIILYTILAEFDALTKEIKDEIKNIILTRQYDDLRYIKEIYELISKAIEKNDKELVEFLLNIFRGIVKPAYNRIKREFIKWIEGKDDDDNRFVYILRILEIIYENNLENLISDAIDSFKVKLYTMCIELNINLRRLLKRRVNSSKRDDAIVLIKVLNDDELKRYLIKSSINK